MLRFANKYTFPSFSTASRQSETVDVWAILGLLSQGLYFMATRFSDIKRGGELKKALDNYTDYLKEAETRDSPRFTGAGTPGTRGKSQIVGVRLFGTDIAPGSYVLSRVSAAALGSSAANFDNITDIGTGTNKRVEYTIDAANVVGEPTGFKRAARLSVFKPSGEASFYKRSKFTKLFYAKKPGKSYSTPFGRQFSAAGTTERFATARAQIIASLKGDNANQFPRVSIREEDYDGNA